MTTIRFPYITESRVCKTCPKAWGVRYQIVEVLYNYTRIQSAIADMEMTEAIHRTNHVLEYIEKEVFNVGT